MKKLFYVLFIFCGFLCMSGCSDDEIWYEYSETEVANRLAIPPLRLDENRENDIVDIYLGDYRDGILDLSVPTYVTLEVIDMAVDAQEELFIIDEEGNRVEGDYLLPELSYCPYWSNFNTPSVSWYLGTEYVTKLTVKLPDWGNASYTFRLKLHQSNQEHIFITRQAIISLLYISNARRTFTFYMKGN